MYGLMWVGFQILGYLFGTLTTNGINVRDMIIVVIFVLLLIFGLYKYISRKKYAKINDKYLIKKVKEPTNHSKNLTIATLYELPKYPAKIGYSYKVEDVIEFLHELNNNEKWENNELDKFYDDLPDGHSKIYLHYCCNPPKQIINKILIRDKFICQKCGKNLLSAETKEKLIRNKDYIQFINKPSRYNESGILSEKNLLTVCKECNKPKVSDKNNYTNKSKNENVKSKNNQLNNFKSDKTEFEENPFEKPSQKIKEAKELLDMGAITQEEFDEIKAKYLDKL